MRGLGELSIDEVLFHHSIPNGFRQVFRLLYEPLAKRFAPDLRRHGVTKAERLPRSGNPLRDIVVGLAHDLGVEDVEVYVSSAQPAAIAVELTEPVSLILGAQVARPDKPAHVRFAAGRALKLARSYLAVPARLSAEELGVLLAGVIRLYDPTFAPSGLPSAQVGEEHQRLSRLIAKRLRDEIAPFATEISGQAFDHHALWRGMHHTGHRAGLLCAGSALAGLSILLWQAGHKDLQASRGDIMVEEFIRFCVSDEHCEARRALTP